MTDRRLLKPERDAEDLGTRPVPEAPGRKRDRGEVRLQMARRQVDEQPADPAVVHGRELGAISSICQFIANRVHGLSSRNARARRSSPGALVDMVRSSIDRRRSQRDWGFPTRSCPLRFFERTAQRAIGGGSEEKFMTASVFVERLRRAGVDQRWEPPVPRVKVSMRAYVSFPASRVPRPSPQRDRDQVESGAGCVSNALRMARASVGS